MSIFLRSGVCALLWAAAVAAVQTPPDTDDPDFAGALWRSIERAGLVGDRALQSAPFAGRRPHGAVLQVFYSRVDVDGGVEDVAVLRSYGGPGVGVQAVAERPGRYLQSVSVMTRRRGDWLWAQYRPDGAPSDDVALNDCAGCHAAAGDDRQFGKVGQ